MEDRPLETRQLDLLNDWLEAPRWEIYQAACLLAGVLPPERTGSGNFGGWLPDRRPWQDTREAWEFTVGEDIAHFEALLRDEKNIADRSPEGFLRLAIRLVIVPPWAEAFVNSGRHCTSISFAVRATLRELLGKSKEANPRANASFAIRALNWPEAVERAAELFETGMTGEGIADVLNSEGFYSGREGTDPYGAAAIRRWRREIMGKPDEGITGVSVADFTAPFREWRDRVKR